MAVASAWASQSDDILTHTPRGDATTPGGSAWLIRHDPWQAYRRGRELFHRQFTRREGAGEPTDILRLADKRTRSLRMGLATSCALCHNVPFGDAGAGPTIAKNGPGGRNTPHLYGAGALEIVAESIRLRLLAMVDGNGDGVVGIGEAAGRAAVIDAVAGSAVDYGRFDDADGDGRPDLDGAVHVWYVDGDGRRLADACRLDDPGVAGYRFAVRAFGWSVPPDRHRAEGVGLRAFIVGAYAVHAGLQAQDPTLKASPVGDGYAGASPTGARALADGGPPDAGRVRDDDGASLDDPDGDGVGEELSAGDIDLVEFHLLNHPQPAERRRSDGFQRGRGVFAAIGCAGCHVPDWSLATPALDRRFTAIAVDDGDDRDDDGDDRDDGPADARPLRGRAVPGGQAMVTGLYSDLRHHDLGPAFHQTQFDGTVVRRFRTAPLWGVGSSAPYGHGGASLDLDAVIRRHGGAAAATAGAYGRLDAADRAALLAFLAGLVLHPVDAVIASSGDVSAGHPPVRNR